MRIMDEAPTIYTIPHYLTIRAMRLRWAAFAHDLLIPIALWLPLLFGWRGVRAAVIGSVIFIGCGAVLQLSPIGAPRTMRRRYRRVTGQAWLIAFVAFCVLAFAVVLRVRFSFLVLGTLALDAVVAAFVFVSAPVSLTPRPEDVPRP